MKKLLALMLTTLMLMSLLALPASATDTTGFASKVVELVNEERAKKNLPALKATIVNLNAAAQKRAVEVSQLSKLAHLRPNGDSWSTIFDEYDVGSCTARGENLASGFATPTAVMAGWMASTDGHKENILGAYTHIGVGVYESGGTIYWCQLFINDGSYTPPAEDSSHIWSSWPSALVTFLRIFLFGWLWMNWI